jgi:hypothetical protein
MKRLRGTEGERAEVYATLFKAEIKAISIVEE